MENKKALNEVLDKLQIFEGQDKEHSTTEQFKSLVNYIDALVKNDFNRLLRILYRVDVSEEKLKKRVAENTDINLRSAEIIAHLLIEREQEKIESRAKYRNGGL